MAVSRLVSPVISSYEVPRAARYGCFYELTPFCGCPANGSPTIRGPYGPAGF